MGERAGGPARSKPPAELRTEPIGAPKKRRLRPDFLLVYLRPAGAANGER